MRRLSSVDYLVNEQGCWLWQLSRNSAGYGMKWDQKDRRLMLAHRWYYERERGAIPAGLQLDHLCGVRVCVNPTHLEAVTPEENARRSIARRPRKPPRIREQPEIRAVDLGACVAWQGCRDRDGYGAKVGGRQARVRAPLGIRAGPRADPTGNDDRPSVPESRVLQREPPRAGQPGGEQSAGCVAVCVQARAPDDAGQYPLGGERQATVPDLQDRDARALEAARAGTTTASGGHRLTGAAGAW
jgi:hypothetical protein